MLGEDLMDQFLSVLCIQQILYRALCDCLEDIGGVHPRAVVDAAFVQNASMDPAIGEKSFPGIEGAMLVSSVRRFHY